MNARATIRSSTFVYLGPRGFEEELLSVDVLITSAALGAAVENFGMSTRYL